MTALVWEIVAGVFLTLLGAFMASGFWSWPIRWKKPHAAQVVIGVLIMVLGIRFVVLATHGYVDEKGPEGPRAVRYR